MKNKETLLKYADSLSKKIGKESTNLVKYSLNYLRGCRDINKFKDFLKGLCYSSQNEKNWEKLADELTKIIDSYTIEELLYILGWCFRLSKYYYSEKQ
jgi:hypothetical protein